VFVEPGPHALVLVGGVVVADQVHGKCFGDLAVDGAQERQELAHTRCTVAADTPALAAIVLHDQWVWPSGVEYFVRYTISSIFCYWMVDLRPRPAGTFPSFAKPSSANRSRHARTVAGLTPTCTAILMFATPSAASNSAFAR
jgi:hypothetical protein